MDIRCRKEHVFVSLTLAAVTSCLLLLGCLERTQRNVSVSVLRVPPQNLSTVSSHHRTVEDYGVYDILHKPQIQFNDAYKNPCWIGKSGNGPIPDDRLHCLPYFYILGVKKSGTTDLYARIQLHSDFAYPGWKESQWLARRRFRPPTRRAKASVQRNTFNTSSIAFYVSMFDKAATNIKAKQDQTENAPYFRKITGDAAPSHLHMHTNWDTLPGNEGLTEPKYTNFHYLKHLTPDMKIILIFRDPVSRLYSDFNHELLIHRRRYHSVPEAFHKQSIILAKTYEDCFRDYSMRRCIYNNTLKQELTRKGVLLGQSFVAGFYEFHMRELYQVFQPKTILPLLMIDYIDNMNTTLTNVYDFLQMRKPRSLEWRNILNNNVRNKSRRKTLMLEKTQDLWKRFYRPFNKQMANLMKDTRYLFQ